MRRMLLVLLCVSACAEGTTLTGRVVGITDGDTLTLLVDRTQHKVRLAQLDTPEKAQPWGSRATQALAEMVFRGESDPDSLSDIEFEKFVLFTAWRFASWEAMFMNFEEGLVVISL